MTTITNEVSVEVQLHTVMMEAFMPAYGKKAVELAYKDEQPELHQEYAACIACVWPLVYRMTQAGVTSSVLDTGEVAEYMLSFVGRNYQFEGNEFITIDNILDVASRLKVWSVTDGVVELNMDMIEVSRKKQSMAARKAGTVERTPRDIAKIGDNWIKKSMSSMKDKVDNKTMSQVAKDAQTYLEAQEFTVNAPMISILANVIKKINHKVYAKDMHDDDTSDMKIVAFKSVLAECYNSVNSYLIQQCDFDARGRIYYQAYNAPHPASDDLRVSLYKISTDESVVVGSAADAAYQAELADISGGKWLTKDVMTKVVTNKEQFVKQVLENNWLLENGKGDANKFPSNPLKYLSMLMDMEQVILNGATSYVPSQPVGLDAKSSGAQIYSILLGDAKLGASCGLTTEYTQDQKINDPYSITARILSSKLGGI